MITRIVVDILRYDFHQYRARNAERSAYVERGRTVPVNLFDTYRIENTKHVGTALCTFVTQLWVASHTSPHKFQI